MSDAEADHKAIAAAQGPYNNSDDSSDESYSGEELFEESKLEVVPTAATATDQSAPKAKKTHSIAREWTC